MKSLYKALSVDTKINEIFADSMEDAIKISLRNEKYKFYLNSELIDVNDRFRVFIFENISYIIKKTSIKKGKKELELAQKAYKYLEGIGINEYKLNIVVPIVKIIDNNAYVITEYKGVSLQECLYSKELLNPLNIEDVFIIIRIFIEKGILYRGFLPRNTIIVKNNIYLLDWEDVLFCDNQKDVFVNKLWETNFLLNWSYFFELEELRERIAEFSYSIKEEPKLIEYEKKFGIWVKWNGKDINLRKKIMNMVLEAEKNILLEGDDFCILPNDLAHLISDLFNSDIDLMFDISCNILRRKNEFTYYLLINKISNLVIYLFKNKLNIQCYVIILVLVILEEAVYNNENITKERYEDLDKFLEKIKICKYELVDAYLQSDIETFNSKLNYNLNSLIKEFTEKDEELRIDTKNISEYIILLSKQI